MWADISPMVRIGYNCVRHNSVARCWLLIARLPLPRGEREGVRGKERVKGSKPSRALAAEGKEPTSTCPKNQILGRWFADSFNLTF